MDDLIQNGKKGRTSIIIITLGVMFFVIGFGIGLSGFLTPALKEAFQLSNVQSYFVTAAIFSAFVIFGRPAGSIVEKIGYRRSMVLAFGIMALGMLLFVPSASQVSFPFFLVALFVGGIGNTLLQAAVNPYVTIIGNPETAATRMCLMGILNKSAWWVAPVFLGVFVDLQQVQLKEVITPFYMVTLILIVLGIFVFFSKIPEIKAKGENHDWTKNFKLKQSLWDFPHLILGIIALFLYVGIETLPMASAIDFAKVSFGPIENLERYASYVTIGLVVGYVFGLLAIPKIISQTRALTIFSVIGIFATLALVYLPSKYGFYALLMVSFANSLMWPAIWPLAIADLGNFTKKGSSMLVMGIVGGAVIPLLFGFTIDLLKDEAPVASVSDYQSAYWMMLPCYVFILYFALKGHQIRKSKL